MYPAISLDLLFYILFTSVRSSSKVLWVYVPLLTNKFKSTVAELREIYADLRKTVQMRLANLEQKNENYTLQDKEYMIIYQ